MLKPIAFLTLAASVVTLGGCDSKSSDKKSERKQATLQVYNASANSPSVSLQLDNKNVITGIPFGDISNNYATKQDNYQAKLLARNKSGDIKPLIERSVGLDRENHQILVMAGDFDKPELIEFSYKVPKFDAKAKKEDKKMEFYVANFVANKTAYEVHLGLKGKAFEDATSYGRVDYGKFTTTQTGKVGSYVLYLTKPNSKDVLFQSLPIDMTHQNSYVLALRDNFGPATLKVAVDRLTTSTKVTSYADYKAVAEYRVYNGLTADVDIVASVKGTKNTNIESTVAQGKVSDYHQVPFGDFKLTAKNAQDEMLLNNLLLTLNQNESKSVLIYPAKDDKYAALTIEDQHRPRVNEHRLSIANISLGNNDVDVYFVRNDETIESAKYKLKDIDFKEVDSIILPNGEYQINVVHGNKTKTLLYQSPALELDASNYLMVLQKDEKEPQGFKLTTLK